MLMADLENWRTKLLDSPWVADAHIRRVFPGTLAVAISERQPLAIARIKETLYLIDRRGTVIDEYGPNYSEFDLPIVDGLTAPGAADGMLLDAARVELVGRLLGELARQPELAAHVSQIDVTDGRDAVLLLKNDTTLVRVGDTDFVDRLQSYFDLAATLRDRVPDIDYVDLRFDERVYVRPQEQGRPKPSATAVDRLKRGPAAPKRSKPGTPAGRN
jgi:cell division septal protein FtsQ